MSSASVLDEAGLRAEPCAVTDSEDLWFLGTLTRMKLEGRQTGGRFALWEGVLPHGAAPPLHSHPQDETFYVIDGEVTAWLVEAELADDRAAPPAWVKTRGRRCGPGAALFAPAGTPHTFRVESDTARMLFLSAPAGIEDYVRALAEPALWPWLQPPAEGSRVPDERIAAVKRELGVIRHGPPPSRS
ncbi:MAG TPA: cupin domain-containing protein [Solirubrobacteraceae bacterium]|nr:cupin domain-containing protein [Solirubrobacteraceae bacterium]